MKGPRRTKMMSLDQNSSEYQKQLQQERQNQKNNKESRQLLMAQLMEIEREKWRLAKQIYDEQKTALDIKHKLEQQEMKKKEKIFGFFQNQRVMSHQDDELKQQFLLQLIHKKAKENNTSLNHTPLNHTPPLNHTHVNRQKRYTRLSNSQKSLLMKKIKEDIYSVTSLANQFGISNAAVRYYRKRAKNLIITQNS